MPSTGRRGTGCDNEPILLVNTTLATTALLEASNVDAHTDELLSEAFSFAAFPQGLRIVGKDTDGTRLDICACIHSAGDDTGQWALL